MRPLTFIVLGLIVVFFTTSLPLFAQNTDVPAEIKKYVEAQGGRKKFPTEINKLVVGDLNGDGKEDAVVQYIVQEGFPGNYFSSNIAVFLDKEGKFVFVTSMRTGTKLTTGLVLDSIIDGIIALDRYPSNSNQKSGTVYYRLIGTKLARTTEPTLKVRPSENTQPGPTGGGLRASAAQSVEPTQPEDYVGDSSLKNVLNGKAIILPKPLYSPAARAVKAGGIVVVQVLVNEEGSVISADAIRGHPLLRAAAESAARAAKFAPALIEGKPVTVSGVIVYNFVP